MIQIAEIEANAYNSYTDANAPSGTIYYKVSIADGPACVPSLRTTGGNLSTISSNLATTGENGYSFSDLIVFPNPSSESASALVQSENTDDSYQLRLLDVTGRLVQQATCIPGEPVLLSPALLPGVYTVEALSPRGKKLVQKWIKQ
jgi:hypothetical protein